MQFIRLVAVGFALAPLLAGGAVTGPSFTGLSDLPGGSVQSTSGGVSADGTGVAGQSSSTLGLEGTRWTTGSTLALGDLPNSPYQSNATDISSNGTNGTRICGTVVLGPSTIRASRWIQGTGSGTGQFQLGTLPTTGFAYSEATAISDDGKRVVGSSTSSSGLRAFRWTLSTTSTTAGTMVNLGALFPLQPFPVGTSTATYASYALGISPDGTKVVGGSGTTFKNSVGDILEQRDEAFLYSGTTMTRLPDLAGGATSAQAYDISSNGTVVVGTGTSAAGGEGVVWTNSVPASVGDLPGGATFCRLYALNSSGTIAVGEGQDDTGKVAVVWNAAFGLRKLSTVLETYGVDITGWTLSDAVGISANGEVITGNGTNPAGQQQAWRIDGASVLFTAIPEIAVEQPAATDIANNGSKDFGSVALGSNIPLTFTIRNTGAAALNLTSTPRVIVGGTHPGDFTVTAQPSTPVAAAGTTTFTVQFAPAASGARSATLTIANNDVNEGSFIVNVSGTGLGSPEIAVEQPAATNIAHNGSKAFGNVTLGLNAPLIFTIRNTGDSALNLTSTPRVIVGGTHPGDFSVTAQPSTPVTSGGGTTPFTVQFAPTAPGARSATLTIANNDADEGSFVINLSGTGQTAYQAWATGGESFQGDANGDGVQDGIAFLLGAATPDADASGLLPTVTENNGDLILEFNCLPIAARGSAELRVAHSNTLASWTATADEVPDATDADPDNNVTFVVGAGPVGPPALKSVTATILSAAAGGGRILSRLEASE